MKTITFDNRPRPNCDGLSWCLREGYRKSGGQDATKIVMGVIMWFQYCKECPMHVPNSNFQGTPVEKDDSLVGSEKGTLIILHFEKDFEQSDALNNVFEKNPAIITTTK